MCGLKGVKKVARNRGFGDVRDCGRWNGERFYTWFEVRAKRTRWSEGKYHGPGTVRDPESF